MATAQFQNQSLGTIRGVRSSPLRLVGQANDPDGNPVDISSGYTSKISVQNNPAQIDITHTATLNADGSWELDISGANVDHIPFNTTRSFSVFLSDDSFSTQALCGSGSFTVTNINS